MNQAPPHKKPEGSPDMGTVFLSTRRSVYNAIYIHSETTDQENVALRQKGHCQGSSANKKMDPWTEIRRTRTNLLEYHMDNPWIINGASMDNPWILHGQETEREKEKEKGKGKGTGEKNDQDGDGEGKGNGDGEGEG